MTDDGHALDHPSVEDLADLAADALPAEHALAVSEHLRDCAACREVVDGAETVRTLLRLDLQPPMPAPVWDRLEAAIAAEVAGAGQTGDSRPTEVRSDTSDGPAGPVAVGGADRPDTRLRRPSSTSSRASSRPSSRPSAQGSSTASRTRRQRRAEDRDARLSRIPRVLAAAAAVVVLLGGLGFGVRQLSSLNGGATSAGSSAADGPVDAQAEGSGGLAATDGAASPRLSADTRRSATGTNYTKATVTAQVRALLAKDQVNASAGGATPLPTAQAPGAESLLEDPAALKSCLTALYADDLQPVAVDLARWEGREAAIIVLPARDGGYEVWAVSRNCTKDDDGTLFFTTIPAS